MGRAACCVKEGLRKGPWSSKEDLLLSNYINLHGEGHWRYLPNNAGLLRCGKSCRLRWMNYLRPGIKRGNFSEDEDDLIVRLHSLLGNRWSLIAGRLPGRTDNEIKNYWNTHLIKKLKSAGIEPKPHKKFSRKESRKKKPQQAEKSKKKNDKKGETLEVEKPEVFAPKPIRISRSNSFENVTLSTSCSSEEGNIEIEDKKNYNIENDENNEVKIDICEVDGDTFCGEFLMEECSNKGSMPMDESMLEKVYEEYLSLLSQNCYIQKENTLPGNVSDHR